MMMSGRLRNCITKQHRALLPRIKRPMNIHTSEKLVKRHAGVVLSPVQFIGNGGVVDKKPIRVGDNATLQAEGGISIQVSVESIDAGKIVGKVISFDGVADDADEYLGMKENDWIAFEERHVWDCTRDKQSR